MGAAPYFDFNPESFDAVSDGSAIRRPIHATWIRH